jgi:hypothetical protein
MRVGKKVHDKRTCCCGCCLEVGKEGVMVVNDPDLQLQLPHPYQPSCLSVLQARPMSQSEGAIAPQRHRPAATAKTPEYYCRDSHPKV